MTNLRRVTIGTFEDTFIGTTYDLVKINAKELSSYLKSSLESKGINYQEFNSEASNDKGYSFDKEENTKTASNPPQEIYEYQNFFLLEHEDGQCVLLDGFRRLLWYNAPDVEVLVRIYKKKELTDGKILSLLVYLNHFKFFGGGSYHDRGFALLLKTVFGLNIPKYWTAFDGYLTSSRVKSDYGSDYGNTKNKKNLAIKERILNPLFISDISFIEKMNDNGCMVNSFMGARLYQERLKSNKNFDFDLFFQHHEENKVLKGLIDKFEKFGTSDSAKSIAVVNQIMEMYDNIFVLMQGGKTEKSYAELKTECKELVKELKKDKSLTKLTGNQSCYLVERIMGKMIEDKKELIFKCVVFPREHKNEKCLEPGLLKEEIKFLGIVKTNGMGHTEMRFGFIDKENNKFSIFHNYGDWFTNGKKYTTLEGNSNRYDIELFVNIPKNAIIEKNQN